MEEIKFESLEQIENMIIQAQALKEENARKEQSSAIDCYDKDFDKTKQKIKLVLEQAIEEDIAIALSCTRWKKLFHLFDKDFLSKWGVSFLIDKNNSFYMVEFVHAAMITLSQTENVTNCREEFSKHGLDFYKEQFIEVFDDSKFEYMDLLLQLVEKIYNYFTRPYTQEENKLKYEFLNIYANNPKYDLEEAIYDLREMYDKDKFEEIYYLMRVVYNQDENLSNIEGLTAENDWKHIILSHYNFETFVYYEFKNCFPDIVAEKPELAKQFDPDEAMFTSLDAELDKYFEHDLFDFEKLRKDCREEYLKRVKKESAAKGGIKSKANHTEPIKIKHKYTGKVLFFSSLEGCAKHLKVGIATIWRFKQGRTKLNAVWEILE